MHDARPCDCRVRSIQGVPWRKYAIVVVDRATEYLDCFPVVRKTWEGAYNAILEFIGPSQKVELMHTDNSGELIKAVEQLGIIHQKALPYRPQSNGVAERAVRTALEGTRCALLQSGVPHEFWPFACRHYCFSRNVLILKGDSAWHKRHGKGQFKGPLIPFGCLIQFLPMPPHRSEQKKLDPKSVACIMLG